MEEDIKKKKSHFSNIKKDGFYDTPINETTKTRTVGQNVCLLQSWQKPKKTIGAFQQKSTATKSKWR
jgi:hypothetical protein